MNEYYGICDHCGEEFNSVRVRRFCSKKCSGTYGGNISGEKSRGIKRSINTVVYSDTSITKIKTQAGDVFTIDTKKKELVTKFTWWKAQTGYFTASTPRNAIHGVSNTHLLLHWVVTGIKGDRQIGIDHINRDISDNRIANLRFATQQQNSANMCKRACNTSGFKGVRVTENKKKWSAYIKYNYKQIYLGIYETKIEAAKAYNKKAVELFGEYARLNNV